MPVGEGGSYVPKSDESGAGEKPRECRAKHECPDGGEGACSQVNGHYGRHLCGSCLGFFGGGAVSTPD